MKTLLEATDDNVKEAVSKPGTHYFVVENHRVKAVRQAVYYFADDKTPIHTSYERVARVLRVTVSST